ncbi:SPOR domain-containing protein [Novosphingobium kunmingense]|nr:SPOR domain-containing protein [Novosphingobium kunmingense]
MLATLAGAAILSVPAAADTRAGVEAWTKGDYAAAVREWTVEAERGDPDALYNLAQANRLGQGVPFDLRKAETLYGRAAQRGHLQAADNYGLLLFQRGEQKTALPFLIAAAGRGEPRAQYLLGVAHFNGVLVAKDWPRAYALVSLAQAQGVVPAASAVKQMDAFIPLEQRQQAVQLSAAIEAETGAARNRQLAAADLGAASPTPPPAASAGDSNPATAGADYARPAPSDLPVKPALAATAPPAKVAPKPATALASTGGSWRIQLGAFAVADNAEALWNRLKTRPALAGHPRILVKAGAVTRLQAGNFASEAAARSACAALGTTCLPVPK